jgi:hypothetical protein
MKKFFLFLLAASLIAACSKPYTPPPPPPPQAPTAFAWQVYDKWWQYYPNPVPHDTTYWLRLTRDTTIPPRPAGSDWKRLDISVPFAVWDTMFHAGQPYPPIYWY